MLNVFIFVFALGYKGVIYNLKCSIEYLPVFPKSQPAHWGNNTHLHIITLCLEQEPDKSGRKKEENAAT